MNGTHHTLDMPASEAQIRALRVDDTVTLQPHAVRHSRRHPDPHVRSRPHDAFRSARPRGDPYRAERAARRAYRRSIRRATSRCASARRRPTRMERFTAPLMQTYGVRAVIGKGGLAQHRARRSPSSAACTWRSSAARRRSRPPGSSRSRTSISTTSTRSRCGVSASATSGRCWSRWTATAAASTPPSQQNTRTQRDAVLASLGIRA